MLGVTLADIYHGSNERAIALRGLAFAAVLTPILLLLPSAREVASSEAVAVAVGAGAVSGIAFSLLLEGVEIGANRSDVTMTVVTLASIFVATVLLWMLLPEEHISTFTQFALVFVWSSSLTSVARHVVWPVVVGSTNARE